MNLFCVLWAPCFLLFWLALAGRDRNLTRAVWAFALGTANSLVHYLVGNYVDPRGFGLLRWLHVFVDIIFVPSALPFLAALVLTLRRPGGTAPDLRVFALAWLIPEGVFRSIFLTFQPNPLPLVLAPLLWTAVAAGVPYFASPRKAGPPEAGSVRRGILGSAARVLGVCALPLAAATSYWAFYAQRPLPGALALAASLSPLALSVLDAHRRTPPPEA